MFNDLVLNRTNITVISKADVWCVHVYNLMTSSAVLVNSVLSIKTALNANCRFVERSNTICFAI
jgi:hypothetical protein